MSDKIDFHYLKTGAYRTYHVDGVFGGATPQKDLYIELFVERAPTPKKITHKLNDNGTLGKEENRDSKSGMIREIEAGLVMNLSTAHRLRDWLSAKIEEIKKLPTEPDGEQN